MSESENKSFLENLPAAYEKVKGQAQEHPAWVAAGTLGVYWLFRAIATAIRNRKNNAV